MIDVANAPSQVNPGFDWKTWIPLLVVAFGWLLTSRTQQRQRDLDNRIKLHDLKVQEYAVWIEGTIHNFRRYIASHPRSPAPGSHVDTSVTRRKLTLLEDDPVLRKLMVEAFNVWPDEGTDLAYDLYCEINSGPDFSYEPFDTVIEQITDRVRATRPTKLDLPSAGSPVRRDGSPAALVG